MATTIDTGRMHADDFVATMPAECCTELGADDYDDAAPEGAAIAVLAVIAGILVLAMLVHVVVSYF